MRHYRALAEAVDIEIVVQDFPPVSGLRDGAGAAGARSRARFRAARTIKLEDPPTPFKTSRILEAVRRASTSASSAASAACSCSRS